MARATRHRDRSGRRRSRRGAVARRARRRDRSCWSAPASPAASSRNSRSRGRRIDAGPTVFTMRDVFEELFADAGATLAAHLELKPRGGAGAPRLGRRLAARPHRRRRRERASHRRVRRRGGSARLSRFRRAQRATFCERSNETFIRASRPNPLSLAARVGLFDIPRLLGDLAVRDAVAGARRAFPRSPAATVVCALRHLLRLLALPRAGDADAGRPCRAPRRLVCRGRNAASGRRAANGRRARRRDIPLRRRGRAPDRRQRPRPRRRHPRRRALRGRRGGFQWRRHRRSAPGSWARRRALRRRRRRRRSVRCRR